MNRRSSHRFRLGLRARLALACLALSVLSSGLLLLLTNALIEFELANVYAREPVIIDLNAPSPGAQFEKAKQADDAAAEDVATFIRLVSVIGLGTVGTVAAGLCWLVAGRALRPVQHITAVASKLSQDTLGDRIAFEGPPDELKTLADSFDAMLDRLARAFDSQRLFVANASHELRAPLTVIRTAVDVTMSRPTRSEADYRRTLSTIETAIRRSERLLDSLLRLARTQHLRTGLQLERLDLAVAARAAATSALDTQPRVRGECSPAIVMADPVLLDLLLRNLIDNATRYNQPDGWVAVRTGVRGAVAVLEVENTGPTVTGEQVAHLTHAFHRGNRTGTREGFGLGLAIVDAIVHAHTGSLDLVPRQQGGLIVTVALPAGPPQPSPDDG